MFLVEPDRTQYDLNFRIFGIDVRVHPMFWLMTLMLSGRATDRDPNWLPHLAAWTVCVFLSILIHEMGHVFMGRLFRADGHIVLYGLGGLAIGSNRLASRWQRMAVSFAGPLAQFILLGLVLALMFLLPPRQPAIGFDWKEALLENMFLINLFWPVLNLLPIYPLDGGQITRELLEWLMPRRGAHYALGLSVLLAGLLAVNALTAAPPIKRPLVHIPFMPTGLFAALFFGMLAYSNFLTLQQMEETNRRWEYYDEPSPWDRDKRDWER